MAIWAMKATFSMKSKLNHRRRTHLSTITTFGQRSLDYIYIYIHHFLFFSLFPFSFVPSILCTNK